MLDTDDIPALKEGSSDIKVEEEDDDLERVLSKARRLKQTEALIKKSIGVGEVQIKTEVKNEQNSESDEEDADVKDNITLNATAEFCRTLGDIPTYGMSGNREVDANDMMDFEQDSDNPVEDEPIEEEEPSTGVWNSVNPDLERPKRDEPIEIADVAILDEEPDVGSGVGAALKLAVSKGYLEREESNRPSNTRMAHLQAKNYSIEDKSHG